MFYIKNLDNNCFYCRRDSFTEIHKIFLELVRKGYTNINITTVLR